jgi:hypothetical protein
MTGVLAEYAHMRDCTPDLLPLVVELRLKQSTSDILLRFTQHAVFEVAGQLSPHQSNCDKKAI